MLWCSEVVELVLFLLREFLPVRVRRVRILVEVRRVARLCRVRNVRRSHLLVEYFEPIDFGEPLVSLDVLGLILEAAESLRSIRSQQLLDQILRVRIKVLREVNLARENLLINAEWILVEKGS